MAGRPDEFRTQLERYLDGQLDAGTRAAFEAAMARDAELAAEVREQMELDAALRRRFMPPAANTVRLPSAAEAPYDARQVDVSAVGDEVPGRRASIPRWQLYVRRFAVAACLLLVVGFGWSLWRDLGPRPRPASRRSTGKYGDLAWMRFEGWYRMAVKEGFEPDVVCTTEPQFKEFTRKQLGQPLLLANVPSSVAALGWSYANCLSPDTATLLVRVDRRPVMVFMDKLSNDKSMQIDPGTGLRAFRRVVDAVVLYEVTPLAQPRVLDLFVNPDRK